MVTKDEFGQLIAEFESFRDLISEEIGKLMSDLERIKDDVDDLKKDISESGKLVSNKKIG